MSQDNQDNGNAEILRRLENIERELKEHRAEETNNGTAITQLRTTMEAGFKATNESVDLLRTDTLALFQKLSLGTLLDSVKREVVQVFGGQLTGIETQLGEIKTALAKLK